MDSFHRVAVIGAEGFIGRHLLARFREAFPDTIGTCFDPPVFGAIRMDLCDPDLESLRLGETGHSAAVIAAGIPSIEFCETNREDSFQVNVIGTLKAVDSLVRQGLKPVFLSSDYVFDGVQGGYRDGDPVHPSTEYGRQKAVVEAEISRMAPDALVIRLSKVIGLEKNDGTLLDAMASSLCRRQEVPAAWDQLFCPTYVADVVELIVALLHRNVTGLINLCVPETWSRYDLAMELARHMNAPTNLVRKVSLDDLGFRTKRPKNTSLSCERLWREYRPVFVPVSECVARVAAHWIL